MQRSQIERLTEIVLGEAVVRLLDNEAVVRLLDNNERINVATVSARLRSMAAEEFNPDRLEAIRIAIRELQMQSAARENREKPMAALGGMSQPRAGKKH
ncbi:hypothetical protein ABNP39_13915 [Pantoea dispersa]|uniref:hypothetical protein n=1 Tax=Pantoea dispersa TaxID=59814 RepID=UPI0032EBCFC5